MSQFAFFHDSVPPPSIGDVIHGYRLEKLIDNTNNSIVYVSQDVSTGRNYAIKFIKYRESSKNRVEMELKLVREINCPFILQSKEIFDYPPYKCIVMPLAIGDLQKIVNEAHGNRFPEVVVKQIMRNALLALKYLHGKNICHRDIKPGNIFVIEEEGECEEVKLGDLGFAKEVPQGELCTEFIGTLNYAAPEVISGVPYDKSVDIWSMGVSMFTMLSGDPPFQGKTDVMLRKSIMSCAYFFPANRWLGITPEAKDLISHMIKKNPKDRYTVDECLAHKWFSGFTTACHQRKSCYKSINCLPSMPLSFKEYVC